MRIRLYLLLLLVAWWLAPPALAARLESRQSTLRILQKQGKWELEDRGQVRARGDNLAKEIEISIEKGETLTVVISDQNPLLFQYTKEIETTETEDYSAAADFAAQLGKLVSVFGIPPIGGAGAPPLTPTEQVRAILDQIRANLEAIPSLLVASASTDSTRVDQAKLDVVAWKVDELKKNLASAYEKANERLQALDPASTVDRPEFLELLRLSGERSTAENGLEELKTFASQMAKVNTPLELAAVEFNPKTASSVTVKIEVNSGNAKLANLTPSAHTIKIAVAPYSPVKLGYGGAVVYSFVDDPSFSTEKVDGGFKILERSGDDDFVGQTVAAMLTLTPRAWDRGGLNGEFHIGVNPEEDEVALFLGGGLRFTNVFSFGLGVTFQEVNKLGSGLSAGELIQAPEELKLDTEYETGFYLLISATTK